MFFFQAFLNTNYTQHPITTNWAQQISGITALATGSTVLALFWSGDFSILLWFSTHNHSSFIA
jgi:hypothetical protein